MTYNTAIRRSVLSSLNLRKVIFTDTVNTQVIIGGEVKNRTRTIYKAIVDGNNEYNDIQVCGYTENDVFNKLNDTILDRFKTNHHSDYENICKTARVKTIV